MSFLKHLLLPVAVASVAVACSSPSSSGSGLDRAKPLIALTDADKRTLCDWAAGEAGGYGAKRSAECDGGTDTVQFAKTQDDCVKGLAIKSSCPADVGDAEDCAIAKYQGDVCSDGGDACKALDRCN